MIGTVVYVLLHRVIGSILHIAGLVLQAALITCVAAAAALLLIWTVRKIQRRRAAAGACTTCRFRCQQSLILRPQPAVRRPRPEPALLPPRVPVTPAGDRHEARPLVLR